MKKIILGIVLSLVSVQAAEATGTFYVDSTTGDDTNNCTAAATPCLTVAGVKTLVTALPDPSNTTIKFNGTFTDRIVYSASDVTAPDTLDGLRITATDQSNQPVLNTAVAALAAVQISGLDHVTVDHLTVTGGIDGVVVSGDSSTYVTDINIHHNDISGLTQDNAVSGIELQYVKSSSVHDNTVHDIILTPTDVSYTYLYPMYVNYAYDLSVQDNTFTALTITATVTGAITNHTNYIYGLYVYNLNDAIIDNNTLSNFTVSQTATAASTVHYGGIFGLYGVNLFDTTVTDNTFSTFTDTVSAEVGDSTAYPAITALLVSDLRPDGGEALIKNNTIDTMTVTQASGAGAPAVTGISLQYGYGATLTENTVTQLSTTHTSAEADSATGGSANGISAPFYGNNNIVSKNTVNGVSANTNYSGASSTSNVTVRGIYQYLSTGSITGNTISNLSWSAENNDTAEYYDYATIYGIDSNLANGTVMKKNTVQDISYDYSSAGTDGTAIFYLYGITSAGSDGLIMQNNIVRRVTTSAAVTDATDQSYLSNYTFGLFFNKAPNVVAHNNRLKNFSITADAGNANAMYNYAYGLSLSGVSGTVSNNRLVNHDVTSQGLTSNYSHLYYGMMLSTGSALTAITGTMMRDITSTTTGENGSHTDIGIMISSAPELILEGNQIRPFDASSDPAAGHYTYGIDFTTDTSHARLLDNIVLGEADSTASISTGLLFSGASSIDVDVIHNTLADWQYPVDVEGGKKVYLRNNILSAIGADSYALAVGRDYLDNDTFKSDYNLLYNTTVADQLIYDTDSTSAIALGDWINTGGSYGYDVNSINKNPKLTALGRLQPGSKAINAGTKDYPYAKADAEMTYLTADINGDQRPVFAKKKKVDIGADEYKK